MNGDHGSLFKGIINGNTFRALGKWIVRKDNEAIATHYGDIGGIIYTFVMTIHSDYERIDCRVQFSHHGETIRLEKESKEFKDNSNGFIHKNKLRFILNTEILRDGMGIRDLPFKISADYDIQGNYWMLISNGVCGIAYLNDGGEMIEEVSGLPVDFRKHEIKGIMMEKI